MLPEISRRCLACGASVRAGGRFCQQCGAKLGDAPGDAADAGARAVETGASAEAAAGLEPALMETWRETDEGVGAKGATGASKPETPSGIFRRPPARAATPATNEVEAAPPEIGKHEIGEHEIVKPESFVPASSPPPVNTAADVAAASPAVGAAGVALKGRRAAAVKESLRPRVERVRDASMGVIEEASEDTGLRFVIISVGLFLLFLFLLLLNSVIN